MLEKLKNINEKLIILNKNDEEELKKQLLIKKILSEPNCFFKMKIDTAFSILLDLQIEKEKIKEIYKELIDIKNLQ